MPMSILPLLILRLAAAVVTAALVGLGPARADTTIALGDGVSLTYTSGMLDPISLEGSATFVRLLIDDRQVALVLSLRLATRGAMVDHDFTITELEARTIITNNAGTLIGEATGRDLTVGTLGTLVRTLGHRRGPIAPDILDMITIGELTLRRVTYMTEATELSADRVHLQGLASGKVAAIEIDRGTIDDENDESRIEIASARIDGLSLSERTYKGFVATDIAVAKDDLDFTIGAMTYEMEIARLPDGTPYAPWSSISMGKIVAQRPGPSTAEAAGAKERGDTLDGLEIALETSARPDGGNFIAAYQARIGEGAGDALAVSARFQIPATSWQLLGGTILTGTYKVAEHVLPLIADALLIDGTIEIKEPTRGDSAAAALGGEKNGERADPQVTIAQMAAGLLSALPGSGDIRDAVSAFIAKSGVLRITASPVHPVPLNLLLGTQAPPRELWEKLNIQVVHSAL
jgi:hypothetical protein